MPVSYEKLRKMFKSRNITSATFRKNHVISQGTWTKINRNEDLNISVIANLCAYLNCQPGDILEYIPDESDDNASEN